MYDFKQIVDSIFKNKHNYREIDDESKEKAFFIINRKFSAKYPLKANSLNLKGVDGAKAIDVWFEFFKNERFIPNFMFEKVDTPKRKTDDSEEIKIFAKYYNIGIKDVEEYKRLLPNDYKSELEMIQNEIKLLTTNKKQNVK